MDSGVTAGPPTKLAVLLGAGAAEEARDGERAVRSMSREPALRAI